MGSSLCVWDAMHGSLRGYEKQSQIHLAGRSVQALGHSQASNPAFLLYAIAVKSRSPSD